MRKIGFALASLLIAALLQGQGGGLGVSALAATGDTLIVIGDGVNVRYAPSTAAKVRMRVSRDQLVTERERQGDWVRVEIAGSDGAEGWIHASLLAVPSAEQLAHAQRRATEPPRAGLPEAKPPAPAGAINPAPAEPAGASNPAPAEPAGASSRPRRAKPPAPATKPPAPATKPPAPGNQASGSRQPRRRRRQPRLRRRPPSLRPAPIRPPRPRRAMPRAPPTRRPTARPARPRWASLRPRRRPRRSPLRSSRRAARGRPPMPPTSRAFARASTI